MQIRGQLTYPPSLKGRPEMKLRKVEKHQHSYQETVVLGSSKIHSDLRSQSGSLLEKLKRFFQSIP